MQISCSVFFYIIYLINLVIAALLYLKLVVVFNIVLLDILNLLIFLLFFRNTFQGVYYYQTNCLFTVSIYVLDLLFAKKKGFFEVKFIEYI